MSAAVHLSYFHENPLLVLGNKSSKTVCGLRVAASKFTCDESATTCSDCRALAADTRDTRAVLQAAAASGDFQSAAVIAACERSADLRLQHYRGRDL